jgi:hypothetical protein
MSAGYDPALFADAASEALSLPCFYLTTHRPNWLWDGRAGYPLMISYRTLRTVARPRPMTAPAWALDSGGFMELAQYGRWTISAREYITAVAEYDRAIGHLDWCPPQDWMCEPGVIHGGRVGHHTFLGTGLSEIDHQRRTIDSFRELTELWPQVSDHPECPVKPVLQGWEPKGYEKHAVMWEEAGVDLAEHEVVGIGSVCRRSSTRAIAEIAKVVGQMNISAHWFGVKLNGIRLGHLIETDRLQPDGDWMPAGTASLDSASWSYDARRGKRLPGCTHVSPKTGEPSNCNNCPAYAAAWRERVLNALRAVYRSDMMTAGHNSTQPSGVLASAAASRGAPLPPRPAGAAALRGDVARRIARPGLAPVRRAPGPAPELELLPCDHRQAPAAPGPSGWRFPTGKRAAPAVLRRLDWDESPRGSRRVRRGSGGSRLPRSPAAIWRYPSSGPASRWRLSLPAGPAAMPATQTLHMPSRTDGT